MLGIFELHVDKVSHSTSWVAKIEVKEVISNLDRDTVAKAYRCFPTRIEGVVEANSHFLNM
jgi:hypothetical protein